MTPKARIEDRAIAGLSVDPHAVAAVGRNRRVVTLRHVWSEDVDARVWDGVRRAYRRLAKDLANSTGRMIEVYSKHGFMLDSISPDD
jgi:hypothetical protein